MSCFKIFPSMGCYDAGTQPSPTSWRPEVRETAAVQISCILGHWENHPGGPRGAAGAADLHSTEWLLMAAVGKSLLPGRIVCLMISRPLQTASGPKQRGKSPWICPAFIRLTAQSDKEAPPGSTVPVMHQHPH